MPVSRQQSPAPRLVVILVACPRPDVVAVELHEVLLPRSSSLPTIQVQEQSVGSNEESVVEVDLRLGQIRRSSDANTTLRKSQFKVNVKQQSLVGAADSTRQTEG